MLKISFFDIHLENTTWRLQPHLTEANELSYIKADPGFGQAVFTVRLSISKYECTENLYADS